MLASRGLQPGGERRGRIKRTFNLWLYTHPAERSMAQYMEALQKIFHDTQAADIIDADVATLPATYKAIKKAKGDWPDRSFM